MADVIPTVNRRVDPDNGAVIKVTWNGLNNNGNIGVPVQMALHSDRCIEVRGTFDGATVVLEGSNGGSGYYTLTNPAGSALTFTAAGLKQVVEGPQFVRPNVTSNINNNTAIVADLILRRNSPLTR
jgi:hypothetical protein